MSPSVSASLRPSVCAVSTRPRSTTTCGPAIAARLIEEYGSAQGAADAVWTLARENEWYREGEAAERSSAATERCARKERSGAGSDCRLDGAPLGRLIHDGFEWRWKPERARDRRSSADDARQAAPFIVSLLPEGWLERFCRTRTSARCCVPGNATCPISRLLSRRRNSGSCRRTSS